MACSRVVRTHLSRATQYSAICQIGKGLWTNSHHHSSLGVTASEKKKRNPAKERKKTDEVSQDALHSFVPMTNIGDLINRVTSNVSLDDRLNMSTGPRENP